MREMKHAIRYFYALAVLLLYVTGARAGGTVNVVTQLAGVVNPDAGQVAYQVTNGICTLTMTPAEGNYISVDHIKVLKTVGGHSAQAPRRSPGIMAPIEVTAVDEPDDLTGVTVYTFAMPDDDYDVEVTADFQLCRLKVGDIVVTRHNRLDILRDGGSVSYDDRNTLVLTQAEVTVPVFIGLDKAYIYLQGSSSISCEGVAIAGKGGELYFTTNGNEPGMLTVRNAEGNAPISGFTSLTYEQNLQALASSDSELTVGTPIKPIVDNTDDTNNVNLSNTDGEDLKNTSIDDVLYTLEEGNGDGYNQDENCIILSTAMAEDDVIGTVAEYKPGTEDFASNFSGITFMLPAGTGNIYITAKTGSEGVLNVMIGSELAAVIQGAVDFEEFVIAYACTQSTYVYIYNASDVRDETTEARALNRAGKKTTITVGISSLGVSSSMVQSSNEVNVTTDRMALTSSDIVVNNVNISGQSYPSVTVNNSRVNELPESAFEDFEFVSYIDLRETGLTGMNVSRSEGAFDGVSKNTFIFMPAGNQSSEPNVIIGQVCDNVVLDANMPQNEAFELAGSFTAQKVVYDRQFEKDEMATVCLPFDIDRESAAAFGTFYTVDKVGNGFVKIDAVTTDLKAHTPYLFRAADDNQQIVMRVVQVGMPENSSAPAPRRASDVADGLYGSYGHYFATDANDYLFASGIQMENVRVIRMQGSDSVLPFQAYLRISDVSVDELQLTEDEALVTGITTVRQAAAPVEWYTVNGLRLQGQPKAKGLYISNGQQKLVR